MFELGVALQGLAVPLDGFEPLPGDEKGVEGTDKGFSLQFSEAWTLDAVAFRRVISPSPGSAAGQERFTQNVGNERDLLSARAVIVQTDESWAGERRE